MIQCDVSHTQGQGESSIKQTKKIELEEKANSAPHSVEAKKKRRKNDVRDNVIEQLYMRRE